VNCIVRPLLFGLIFIALTGFISIPCASAKIPPEGLFVTQIAINPLDPDNLYALTTYSIGLLKTTDGGRSWNQINQGVRSYSLYQITVHPKDPRIVYLGAGGAGLYKSTDGGGHWVEMNDGLQNTDIGMLMLHPSDPETVYIVTSTGLFKSPDGGKSWIALNQGDHFTESQQFQSLIVIPTTPTKYFLASKIGLFKRQEGDAGWVPVGGPFADKHISVLARDPRTGRLYAAILRRGTLETLHEGGLFMSDDEGETWSRLGTEFSQDWVRMILIDPDDSRILYIGTTGRGVLKSIDGGKTWKEINVGLTDPDLDIHTLVRDPRNPKVLYAGSHGDWVFRSDNAGQSWSRLPLGPHETASQLLAAMNREDQAARQKTKVKSPAEFQKCNRCHGWTDPNINLGKFAWRVSANRRDWALTVKRMSKGAELTPEEATRVADFLNGYTSRSKDTGTQGARADEIQVSVLKGNEEEDPVIAWDGMNYMAVWQTNRKDPEDYDLYAARVGPDGRVLDPRGVPISTASSNQIFADIASGNDQYFVVWQDLRSRKRWEIYGARVRPDGEVLDPEGIPIATGGGNAQYPQIAWGQDSFMVVWMEENEGQGWDVAGMRLAPDGRPLDSKRILISGAPGDQTHPTLAWSGKEYLVVWMENRPGSRARISGKRLTGSGTVVDPEGLQLSGSAADPSYPAVGWARGRFVVVWSDKTAPQRHALSGVQLTRAGESVQTRYFTIASGSNLHAFPSIRCSGQDCLVVWEEDQSHGRPMRSLMDIRRDVRGSFLDFSQSVIAPRQDIMIAEKAVGNHFAKVASDNRGYLVVWKDYRSGTAASLGRFITPP
jgi:photosystem II stability/assembly factor-like uncharacterized protein